MSHRAGYNRPYVSEGRRDSLESRPDVPSGRLAARHAGPTGRGGPCRPLSSAAGGCRGLPSRFPAAVLPAAGPTTAWAKVTGHSTWYMAGSPRAS